MNKLKNSTVESLLEDAAEYSRKGHIEVAQSVLRFAQYDLMQILIKKAHEC